MLRVTFVGCGALGCVYAAHLARAGAQVFALTRQEPGTGELELARRYPKPFVEVHSTIERCRAIPRNTELVVLAVRLEQLDERLCVTLAERNDVPLVALTPLFPNDRSRVARAIGKEPICAMPAVASHFDAGVARYFVPPLIASWVDAEGRQSPAVRAFVEQLDAAGLPVRFRTRVAERNLATTTAFFPLSLGLAIAGGVAALAERTELLDLTSAATRETRKLARQLGPLDFAISGLTQLATARRLAWVCRRGVTQYPELVRFLDEHFAQKLTVQHGILAREILALGNDHQGKLDAFERLYEQFVG